MKSVWVVESMRHNEENFSIEKLFASKRAAEDYIDRQYAIAEKRKETLYFSYHKRGVSYV